ncbi:MAG: uracil phosphoribosyltransferase [Bacteroidaceae bacterium]|nr:uracil phosphoribosyltransferase [Bacteroidaceae bacterium]
MQLINLSEQNTILNKYLAEIRNKNYQGNRLLFRNNVKRIGHVMAYELSKTLQYSAQDILTPLGVSTINLPDENDIVIATILRAGLPFHEGFLDVFDHANNAFVSAYRSYTNENCTEIAVHVEYLASPAITNKTLIIADPMLATGESMELGYQAFLSKGTPAHIHVACIIATQQATDYIKSIFPEDKTTIWCAAIDPELNEHKYIVPGLGDAGDLCYGSKE